MTATSRTALLTNEKSDGEYFKDILDKVIIQDVSLNSEEELDKEVDEIKSLI